LLLLANAVDGDCDSGDEVVKADGVDESWPEVLRAGEDE
jgi:hypothetical protein